MEIIHSFDTQSIINCNIQNVSEYSVIILDSIASRNSLFLRNKGISEISLYELDDEERILCEKKYIETTSELSCKFRFLEWWANQVSEKNEHISSLYKNVTSFYILIKTLEQYQNDNKKLFVVCNSEIFEQLKDYSQNSSINLTSLESSLFLHTLRINQILYDLSKIVFLFIKTIIKKTYAFYKLRHKTRRGINNNGKNYVIRTWLDNRFLKVNSDYEDSFFGCLPKYAEKQGYRVVQLVNINNNYFKIVNKIFNTKHSFIIPEEYFLKFTDLCCSLFYLHFKKTILEKKILLHGVDVTKIFEKEVARGFLTADYLKNIFRYFIAKRFTQTIKFKTYVQPFENYAWEKMTTLGLRKGRAQGKILGFQHAFISRNSFKYFPGKMERDVIPLPDKVITMGKVTKHILEEYGSYNEEVLTVGCALRQQYINDLKPFKRRYNKKIVVPLTMVKSESLLILNFLYESALPQSEMKVVIRCHPAAPFETFKKNIDFQMPENFKINNEKSIVDELSDTDIVLYTWTTVALEALKLGLPVIYLDILSPMYVDSLFQCTSFKRIVKKPCSLQSAIESFYQMNDKIFYKEQLKSQEYLKRYFLPVNDENIAPFFAA